MTKEITGSHDAKGLRFGIVVSRFNEYFTRKLLEGAVETLVRSGAASSDITICWVPGAFEIPLAVQAMAGSGNHDAVVALGLVIKGETSHHEIVGGEAAAGIARAGMITGVPCTLGVVTTENPEQAMDRCGGKHGNRGADAALAAVEMVNLLPRLEATEGSPATSPQEAR